MFKKTISLFLITVMCLATSVLAAETFEHGGVTYSVDVDYDESREDPYGDITVTALTSASAPAASFKASDILKYLGYDSAEKEATILSSALEDSGELEIAVKVSESSALEEVPSTSVPEPEGFIDENGMFLQEDPDEVPVSSETPSKEDKPAENAITVILHDTFTFEDTTVTFPDQNPVIVEGRTLVPARGVFEQMNYMVDWDGETSTAIVTDGSTTIKIPINEKYLLVNDKQVEIDVPAQLIGSRTMIPLRAISQALGMTVNWDEKTRTVHITY